MCFSQKLFFLCRTHLHFFFWPPLLWTVSVSTACYVKKLAIHWQSHCMPIISIMSAVISSRFYFVYFFVFLDCNDSPWSRRKRSYNITSLSAVTSSAFVLFTLLSSKYMYELRPRRSNTSKLFLLCLLLLLWQCQSCRLVCLMWSMEHCHSPSTSYMRLLFLCSCPRWIKPLFVWSSSVSSRFLTINDDHNRTPVIICWDEHSMEISSVSIWWDHSILEWSIIRMENMILINANHVGFTWSRSPVLSSLSNVSEDVWKCGCAQH